MAQPRAPRRHLNPALRVAVYRSGKRIADLASSCGFPNFTALSSVLGYAAVVAGVLKAEVGNRPPDGVEVASRSIEDAVTMRMDSFDEWVSEVSYSRTLGGVHYRFSNEAGEEIGRRAAAAVLQLMKPLKGQ